MRERAREAESDYRPLAGFSLPPPPKKESIALIVGLSGHGKTTFGLYYAPDPVAFFDVDGRGLTAARRAVRKGKRISYTRVEIPRKAAAMDHKTLMRMAEKEVSRILTLTETTIREGKNGKVRTAVIDTVSEFGTLLTMSVTGSVHKRQDDFGRSTHMIKTSLADIIEMYRASNVNLIMLGRAKEVWVGHESTGKYTLQGLDVAEYGADWGGHLRLARDKKTGLYRSQEHEMEIIKAGNSIKQLGQVYTEEEWGADGPFVYGCVKNHPGSCAADWL